MLRRTIFLIAALALSACSYDGGSALTCSDEGAELDGRRCTNGVWVLQGERSDVAEPDVGSADSTTDTPVVEDSDIVADMPSEDAPIGDIADMAGPDADADPPDADACIPESPADFCARAAVECGDVTADDNCAMQRTEACGDCGANGNCTANACVCDAGYIFDAAAGECVNRDECADGTAMCDANATCADLDGSFTCTCNSPFTGDGFTCTTPYPILEEIVFTESTAQQFDTPDMTAMDNELYVAFIAVRTASRDVQGVDGLGLTWTKLDELCNSTDVTEATLEVWIAQGDAIRNGPITVRLSDNPYATAIAVHRYSNVANPANVNLQLHNDSDSCNGLSPQMNYEVQYTPMWAQSLLLVGTFLDVADHSPAPGWIEHTEQHAINMLQWVGLSTMTANNVTGNQATVRGVFNVPVHWITAILEIEAM